MLRKIRNKSLAIMAAVFIMTAMGVPLFLHLHVAHSHHDCDHDRGHDSKHCSICQAVLLGFAKCYVEPPTSFVLTEDMAVSIPETDVVLGPQFIASVQPPRPPPAALA